MTEQNLIAELKRTYDYSPETGYFTRIRKTSPKTNIGDIAGDNSKALFQTYIQISLNGKPYSAHRVAWLLMTGEWPKDQIDHINGNGLDNRLVNLRECNHAQNMRNRHPSPKSKSGYQGVYWRAAYNMWESMIWVGGEFVKLGMFECKHEAAKVYNNKVVELYDEFKYKNVIIK